MAVKKKEIIVVVDNHFDQMWRRCFRKNIVHNGQIFVSYSDIEAFFILDNLSLAGEFDDYKFQIEGVITVDVFLDRFPDKKDELINLYKEKRLSVQGSGYVIIDSNLSGGESLIRNYVIGNNWLYDMFGEYPVICLRNDGFGNSAQLPQIMRGCGFKWVNGISYVNCAGDYWRGLDGSVVCQRTLPILARAGGVAKYAPCPVCEGHGTVNENECPTCNGRGIDTAKVDRMRTGYTINEELFNESDQCFLYIWAEEILPVHSNIEWVKSLADKYDIRYGFQADAYPYVKDYIEAVDDPKIEVLQESGDLNPFATGCYVSRIKGKQNVRRNESIMQASDTLATMVFLQNGVSYRERLNNIWKDMFFTMFHDAVTGCHVDPANLELHEYHEQIKLDLDDVQEKMLSDINNDSDTITILNPTGNTYDGIVTIPVCKGKTLANEDGSGAAIIDKRENADDKIDINVLITDLKPFAAKCFKQIKDSYDEDLFKIKQSDALPSSSAHEHIENRRFFIRADDNGITSIFDKMLEKDILVSADYRPGEYIMEHEDGHPWGMMESIKDRSRMSSSEFTKLTNVTKEELLQRLSFQTKIPANFGLFTDDYVDIKWSVTLVEGLDRIDFHSEIYWSTFNRLLRIAFPCAKAGRGFYEIPYGYLKRDSAPPPIDGNAMGVDWAVANWVGMETEDVSVVVFNKGTPSCRIEKENIFMSILRSPGYPANLHEPASYSMTQWDGLRDEGYHSFDYAITAYKEPFTKNKAVIDGQNYLATIPVSFKGVNIPEMPVLDSDNIYIAVVKVSEDDQAVIIRLAEYSGIEGKGLLKLPSGVKAVYETDMMEREINALEICNNTVSITAKPFKIITLKLLF